VYDDQTGNIMIALVRHTIVALASAVAELGVVDGNVTVNVRL